MSLETISETFDHLLSFSPLVFYSAFFGLTMLEGPITTFVVSAVAAASSINIYLIFVLSVVGDMISDVFLYYLGRTGRDSRVTRKYLSGENTGILLEMEKMSKQRPLLFYFLVKVVPSWATPGLYYLGFKKENFKKYFLTTLSVTVFNTLIVVSLGYFSIVTLRGFEWFHSVYRSFGIAMMALVAYIWLTHHHRTKSFMEKMKDKVFGLVDPFL